MTKKEWINLKIGDNVLLKTWIIDKTQTPPKPIDIQYYGIVKEFNSNKSQARIIWDNKSYNWHGRTQIELEKCDSCVWFYKGEDCNNINQCFLNDQWSEKP
jgi:hypothetical protein